MAYALAVFATTEIPDCLSLTNDIKPKKSIYYINYR